MPAATGMQPPRLGRFQFYAGQRSLAKGIPCLTSFHFFRTYRMGF